MALSLELIFISMFFLNNFLQSFNLFNFMLRSGCSVLRGAIWFQALKNGIRMVGRNAVLIV